MGAPNHLSTPHPPATTPTRATHWASPSVIRKFAALKPSRDLHVQRRGRSLMSPHQIAVSGLVLVMLGGCSSTSTAPRGFIPAQGAATDRATGLPTRVVHEA